MDFTNITEHLEKKGYRVFVFQTAKEASDFLVSELAGKSIGFGGSMTIREMGLFESLSSVSDVYWHWNPQKGTPDTVGGAADAEIYISSANAISESGEIVNIDGTGNRVASTIFGHERVIFLIGKNKIAKTLNAAMDRARNVAAPQNARRLGRNTPCAVRADKCYDCDSAERICSVLSVFFKKPGSGAYDVVLIDEALGY